MNSRRRQTSEGFILLWQKLQQVLFTNENYPSEAVNNFEESGDHFQSVISTEMRREML